MMAPTEGIDCCRLKVTYFDHVVGNDQLCRDICRPYLMKYDCQQFCPDHYICLKRGEYPCPTPAAYRGEIIPAADQIIREDQEIISHWSGLEVLILAALAVALILILILGVRLVWRRFARHRDERRHRTSELRHSGKDVRQQNEAHVLEIDACAPLTADTGSPPSACQAQTSPSQPDHTSYVSVTATCDDVGVRQEGLAETLLHSDERDGPGETHEF